MEKPIILVTNDDGISAKGLRKLIEIVKPLGIVYVVASEKSQSGQGHAVTVREPLRMEMVNKEKNYEEYVCNGTPVDCIKLGSEIAIGRKPDLVVSGINHGSNASVNIVYSGTMAAVVEACIDEIPAIGFSLDDYSSMADFDHVKPFATKIINEVLENGLPMGICLNVNIPAINGKEIKGIRICRQARARWKEEFDVREDPYSKKYYWLKGRFTMLDEGEETDQWALENKYISIVPVHFDLTAHYMLDEFKTWDFNV